MSFFKRNISKGTVQLPHHVISHVIRYATQLLSGIFGKTNRYPFLLHRQCESGLTPLD